MKRMAHIAVLLLATACGDAAQRAAEDALHEGAPPYREGRYVDAAAIYGAATHDPRVAYNLGNTFIKQHLPDTALRAYAQAIERGTNDADDAMSWYNMGNGWATLAHDADSMVDRGEELLKGMRIEGDDIAMKLRSIVARDSIQQDLQRLEHLLDSALAQSADAYKNTLRRTPADEDARYNLALVQKHIAMRVKEAAEKAKNQQKDKDQELSERALKLMQQADELVDQYKFTEALKLLQDGLKTDPSLKQKQEYMNKLDVVTKAAQAK